jgi:hypothetical protein
VTQRGKVSIEIQEFVRQRAAGLCEYCHTQECWQYVRFTVDHVVPLSKGGTDDQTNLALACFHCNRRKSNHMTAIDSETGDEAALYNPRKHIWQDHFIWSVDGLSIIGLTSIGRATVTALEFNRERVLNIRSADGAVNRHPPVGDPVQKAT